MFDKLVIRLLVKSQYSLYSFESGTEWLNTVQHLSLHDRELGYCRHNDETSWTNCKHKLFLNSFVD